MKGGGSSYTYYTYTATFAVGICEGPIDKIRRMWGDGKLLCDPDVTVKEVQNGNFLGLRHLGGIRYIDAEEQLGTGDGSTATFNYTVENTPLLERKDSVTIKTKDSEGNELKATSSTISPYSSYSSYSLPKVSAMYLTGDLKVRTQTSSDSRGTNVNIGNYVDPSTGEIQLTFGDGGYDSIPPGDGEPINVYYTWKVDTNDEDGEIVDLDEDFGSNRVYIVKGTTTQLPHPVIEAHEGAGNVPAYRGLAYAVFENFQLGEFGNRIPNIEFEVCNYVEREEVQISVDPTTEIIEVSALEDFYILASRTNDWLRVFDSSGSLIRSKSSFNVKHIVLPNVDFLKEIYGDSLQINVGNIVYLANDNGDFIEFDAITGEEYSRDSGFWSNHSIIESVPEEADVAYMEEYGGAVWAVWADMATVEEGSIYRGGVPSGPVKRCFALFYCDSDGRPTTLIANTQVIDESDEVVSDPSNNADNVLLSIDNDDNIYISYRDARHIIFKYSYWRAWAPVGYEPSHVDETDLYYGPYYVSAHGELNGYGNSFENFGDYVELNTDMSWIGRVFDTSILLAKIDDIVYAYDGMTGTTMTASVFPTSENDTSSDVRQDVTATVEDLLRKAGLTQMDFFISDNLGKFIGFPLNDTSSAKDALQHLMTVFQFDVVEAEGQIKCLPGANRDTERIFSEDDLVMGDQSGGGNEFTPVVIAKREQEIQLPTMLVLEYLDMEIDFQKNAQYARMHTPKHRNIQTSTVPLVLDGTTCLQISERLLQTRWEQRTNLSFSVDIGNIDLLPGTVVEVAGYKTLIKNIRLKSPGLIEVEGVTDEPSTYESTITTEAPSIPAQDTLYGGSNVQTNGVFMNLPSLIPSNQTAGFFVVPFSTSIRGWKGAGILKTEDGGDSWGTVDSVSDQILVADIFQAPNDGPTTRWDYDNVITIVPLNTHKESLLESISEDSALAGGNLAAIGTESIGWELISFVDVVDNGDGSYDLFTLIRGRRGTERNISVDKNTLVLFKNSDGVGFVPVDSSNLGTAIEYKVSTQGRSLDKTSAKSWASEGDTIKPWNPVYVEAIRNSDGDISITWLRRSRGEDSWKLADVPLYENTESYEVDILDSSGNVVRTISTSGIKSDREGITYTATQQNEDFGSLQDFVTIKVYQISDVVGRGFPKSTIV